MTHVVVTLGSGSRHELEETILYDLHGILPIAAKLFCKVLITHQIAKLEEKLHVV